MIYKLRQQIHRHNFSISNRLPNRRARQFLSNYLRFVRSNTSSSKLRAALGLTRWNIARVFHNEARVSVRFACFVTGRFRGMLRRFSVTRTRIKPFTDQNLLFGVRKSSW